MKRLFISKVVMEHYDCSEKFECLSTYNGCLYDKAERYLLHRAIGHMGDLLCKKFFDLGMKQVQEHISQQEVLPLLQIGVLEMMEASQFEKVFNELYTFSKAEQEWIKKAKIKVINFLDKVDLTISLKEHLAEEICTRLVRLE